jgi:hypothetical protein
MGPLQQSDRSVCGSTRDVGFCLERSKAIEFTMNPTGAVRRWCSRLVNDVKDDTGQGLPVMRPIEKPRVPVQFKRLTCIDGG